MIVILVTLRPSFTNNELMHGTQSGKTCLFLWIVIGISALWLFKLIIQFPKQLYFSQIDLLLFLWAIYVLLNSFVRFDPIELSILSTDDQHNGKL